MKVRDILWARQSKADVPSSFEVPHGGLMFGPGLEVEAHLAESVVLEVGHTYIAPIYYDAGGIPEWQALSPSAILPFDGGMVGAGSTDEVERAKTASRNRSSSSDLWGQTAAQVIRQLDETTADPRALEYFDLKPRERYERVIGQTDDD